MAIRLGPQHGVQRFLRKVLISIALGLPGIGLIALVTRTPEGNSMAFPFAWSAPTSPCFAPNPLNGCGFTYNVPMIALDYAIWVGLIFALLVAVQRLRSRASKVAPS